MTLQHLMRRLQVLWIMLVPLMVRRVNRIAWKAVLFARVLVLTALRISHFVVPVQFCQTDASGYTLLHWAAHMVKSVFVKVRALQDLCEAFFVDPFVFASFRFVSPLLTYVSSITV